MVLVKGISGLVSVAIAVKWLSSGIAPTSTVQVQNEDNFGYAVSCIDHAKNWEVDFSNFSTRSVSERKRLPSLQIMRLTDTCILSNREVPVMRIVGFFPGILPSTLFELLTDREYRLKWDFNYRMFEGFLGGQTPVERVFPLRQRGDSTSDSIPHVVTSLNSGWFAHRVGSALLSSLGIGGRQFLYFRRNYQVKFLSKDPRGVFSAYHAVYDGCDQTIEKAIEDQQLSTWVKAHKEATTAVHSKMNYQHIVLLPVGDAENQIFSKNAESFSHVCRCGSIFDFDTFHKFLSFSSDSLSQAQNQRLNHPQGTLCVITSVNDIYVPPSIPKWVQKKIASSLTVKIYDALMNGALRYHSEGS